MNMRPPFCVQTYELFVRCWYMDWNVWADRPHVSTPHEHRRQQDDEVRLCFVACVAGEVLQNWYLA